MLLVLWISLAFIVLRLAAELFLGFLNRREVVRHAKNPPPSALAIMDRATYDKSVAYTLERSRFGALTEVFDTFVLVLVLFGGFLPWLYYEVGLLGKPEAAWSGALFLLACGLILSIPSLPFSWWSQFRIEARYGFNKSSAGLWVGDRIKGLILAGVLGFPILWALLALVSWAGDIWWIWGFAFLFVVQLVLLVVYPMLILPLFNKLTPLPQGELRDRLMALAQRTHFKARTIQVIDGSKRSAHSNAYFTGFGRFRRIVLFDTLIGQLTTEELEAVLAHEIGHYRKGHIPKRLVLSAVSLLAGLFVIGWLSRALWFNLAFSFPAEEMAPTFLLFALLSGAVTYWFSPLSNLLSRKHEYEADAFARDAMGSSIPLTEALRKLAQNNLANLTPHPWFSAFHYSHPTLAEREAALSQ